MVSTVQLTMTLSWLTVLAVTSANPFSLSLNPPSSNLHNKLSTRVTTASNADTPAPSSPWNASSTLGNQWPSEPFHYAIPHIPLDIVFSSYGHYLDKDSLLGLFQQAYHDTSLKIIAEGPRQYIGDGYHLYSNSALGVMFYLIPENLHMCWLFFRETVNGLRQVVSHFGGQKLHFEVEHNDWGLVATGAFEGL